MKSFYCIHYLSQFRQLKTKKVFVHYNYKGKNLI